MADLRMPDLNSIMIAGNLVRDPKLNHTMNGTPVSNFTIVSNQRFNDKFGESKENAYFIGVVAWYNLGESCAKYLHQGSAVLIAGELQSRQLKTEDGRFRNMVEVKARRVQFLDKPGEYLSNYDLQNRGIKDTDSSQITSEKESKKENDSSNDEDNSDITSYDFGFRQLKL